MDEVEAAGVRPLVVAELKLYEAAHLYCSQHLARKHVPAPVTTDASRHVKDAYAIYWSGKADGMTIAGATGKVVNKIRLLTADCYDRMLTQHRKIGNRFYLAYLKQIESRRERDYWLYDTMSDGEIVDAQVNLARSRPRYDPDHIHELSYDDWASMVGSIKATCESYRELNKKLAAALRENRKFRDDLLRATAARVGIAVSILIAGVGQSDRAFQNIAAAWQHTAAFAQGLAARALDGGGGSEEPAAIAPPTPSPPTQPPVWP